MVEGSYTDHSAFCYFRKLISENQPTEERDFFHKELNFISWSVFRRNEIQCRQFQKVKLIQLLFCSVHLMNSLSMNNVNISQYKGQGQRECIVYAHRLCPPVNFELCTI